MGGQAKGKKKNKPKRKENRSNKDAGIVGLTPQERMKVRMHEKAKKKTAEKYSVQQLLEKTEECMDSFDFETAGLFCQRALDVESNNLQALDMLGNIHSELGDTQKAKEVFLQAVQLSPDVGHSKYMYLGQINSGQEAVNYYTRGIQVMLSALEKEEQTTLQAAAAAPPEEDPERPTAKDISVAYCSIAEIYLADLCMEEGAADKCRESIERALQYHYDNPEALQLMASYLFSTERNQEGKEYLLKSVGLWLPAQSAASSSTEEELQNLIPPYESRITTAKLLMESEEYEMAVDVLEGLLEEDDEVVQVWYLSGWVCYLQLEKAKAKEQQESEGRGVTEEEEKEEQKALTEAARSYLTNAKKLYSKLRCDDQPVLEHVEQLLGELGGELEGEEGDPVLDDDYEPCSDEEEGDVAEAPMEH